MKPDTAPSSSVPSKSDLPESDLPESDLPESDLSESGISEPRLGEVCTTREAAKLLGVSLRTIQQWVEQGALRAYRTVGGHRRVARASVQEMLRERKSSLESSTRLLVVEDDPDLLKLYGMTFRQWNLPLEVRTANDGVRALLEIGDFKPEVLVMDLQMPRMDGFHLIRTLKAMPGFERMEVIVVSGLAPELLHDRPELAGVLVLNKPVSFERLREHLESRLRGRFTARGSDAEPRVFGGV
jgi:excisionase family DNA binding protein